MRLKEVLADYTQEQIASRVGLGQQTISAYLRRAARPSSEVREALEREFGIPFADWYTDAEYRLARGRAPSSAQAPDAVAPADESRPRLAKAAPRRRAAS